VPSLVLNMPFEHGERGQAAVKVIDGRGNALPAAKHPRETR